MVGTLAIGAPFVASLATALTLGVLLVAGGIAELVGSFWTRDWSGFFLMLLMGLLYVAWAFLSLNRPVSAIEPLTFAWPAP